MSLEEFLEKWTQRIIDWAIAAKTEGLTDALEKELNQMLGEMYDDATVGGDLSPNEQIMALEPKFDSFGDVDWRDYDARAIAIMEQAIRDAVDAERDAQKTKPPHDDSIPW